MNALPDISHETRIAAPPQVVWDYLTKPQHVVRWLGCLRYEGTVGSLFYMQPDEGRREADDIEGATHCRITRLDAPRTFAFAWFLPGTPETEVRIQLTKAGDGATAVRLTHSGWAQFDAQAIQAIYDALSQGWGTFVLPQLKATVESAAST